jgi:uncharacterized protein Usg
MGAMTRRSTIGGYRLTTAEIVYHLPDHPDLLQTFVWQDYDLIPKLPVLTHFLDFWRHNIDGALHSVRVCTAPDGSAGGYRNVVWEGRLH